MTVRCYGNEPYLGGGVMFEGGCPNVGDWFWFEQEGQDVICRVEDVVGSVFMAYPKKHTDAVKRSEALVLNFDFDKQP